MLHSLQGTSSCETCKEAVKNLPERFPAFSRFVIQLRCPVGVLFALSSLSLINDIHAFRFYVDAQICMIITRLGICGSRFPWNRVEICALPCTMMGRKMQISTVIHKKPRATNSRSDNDRTSRPQYPRMMRPQPSFLTLSLSSIPLRAN